MASTFEDIFSQYSWNEVKDRIYQTTPAQVEHALQKDKRSIQDFMALVAPAAAPYLEQMARISHQCTQTRFGKTLQLYLPLYLSNECQNICTYCGFSLDNRIRRKTLTQQEIMDEVTKIKEMGYDHILLVTGESHKVSVPYFQKVLRLIRPYFSHISMEVQPLDQEEYQLLMTEGLNTVLVYQETYHQDDYRKHHPKGKKANFEYRLQTPDRLGRAGIFKIGLGALYGLEDWRTDSFFTALHLQYLERTYWKTRYSISFPRLRPFSGGLEPKVPMSDRDLVQVICAYRLFNEDVELSLSTRETEKFRDHAIKLGITSISAGSKTNPGGYTSGKSSLEQFEISDERSPEQIQEMIRRQGYTPVWKDWDRAY